MYKNKRNILGSVASFKRTKNQKGHVNNYDIVTTPEVASMSEPRVDIASVLSRGPIVTATTKMSVIEDKAKI